MTLMILVPRGSASRNYVTQIVFPGQTVLILIAIPGIYSPSVIVVLHVLVYSPKNNAHQTIPGTIMKKDMVLVWIMMRISRMTGWTTTAMALSMMKIATGSMTIRMG